MISSKITAVKHLNILRPIFILFIFNGPYVGKAEELKKVESTAVEKTDCIEVKPICPNGNLTYFLYTKTTQDSPYEIIDRNEESAKNAPFMQNVPFKLLIHAFTGNKNFSPNKEIRPVLFEEGEYNVISVDWSPFAKVRCTAAPAINVIGNCTAGFLNWLFNVRSDVISANKTHVIGLSMGALIAGATGKNIQQFGYKLSWITALDPANLAYFNLSIPISAVNASDAIFVDSIHTNVNEKGLCGPNGHVDFYINNGYIQSGCDPSNASCSHIFAAVIYGRTIRPSVKHYGAACDLTSCCNSTTDACIPNSNYYNQLMGFYVPHTARGIYQVPSN